MQLKSTLLLALSPLLPLVASQAAAGGGVGVAVPIQATQDATVRTAGSIFTVNGVTSVTYGLFTQTFATTALGTWAFGPTPKAGVIGLGDIQGEVGKVKGEGAKSKRGLWAAVPTQWGF